LSAMVVHLPDGDREFLYPSRELAEGTTSGMPMCATESFRSSRTTGGRRL